MLKTMTTNPSESLYRVRRHVAIGDQVDISTIPTQEQWVTITRQSAGFFYGAPVNGDEIRFSTEAIRNIRFPELEGMN